VFKIRKEKPVQTKNKTTVAIEKYLTEEPGKYTLELRDDRKGEIEMNSATDTAEAEGNEKKKIVKLVTKQTFEHVYFIEADSREEAEKILKENEVEEASQEWQGEVIMNTEEVTEEELDKWLEESSKNPEMLCSDWLGRDIIHKS